MDAEDEPKQSPRAESKQVEASTPVVEASTPVVEAPENGDVESKKEDA